VSLLKEWDGDEGVEEIDWFDDDFFVPQVMCFHFMARSVSSALDLFVLKKEEN
jgi:hypothetical protein